MNTQNLISILEITSIDELTIEQLHNLLAQAYNALAELEAYPIEYLKMLSVIRRIEMRLSEIKSQPYPVFHPHLTP
ncbi:MAG: hypothetical protein KUG80_09255 [Gammaproteobacteria bacterium]|nr:hypothetical protein [Gammaproteobacteria bacterium]